MTKFRHGGPGTIRFSTSVNGARLFLRPGGTVDSVKKRHPPPISCDYYPLIVLDMRSAISAYQTPASQSMRADVVARTTRTTMQTHHPQQLSPLIHVQSHLIDGKKRPMFQTFSSLSVKSAAFSANRGSSLSVFFRFCAAGTQMWTEQLLLWARRCAT